jgi:hypothetical protein
MVQLVEAVALTQKIDDPTPLAFAGSAEVLGRCPGVGLASGLGWRGGGGGLGLG